jgi:hypothetical protein
MISLFSKEIMESGDGPVLIDFVPGWQSSDVIDDGIVFKWLVVDDRQIASRFCEAIRSPWRDRVCGKKAGSIFADASRIGWHKRTSRLTCGIAANKIRVGDYLKTA